MKSSYKSSRGLGLYLGGAAAARAGDEMSGPALLLLGFAVTGRASTGSELLASLTIAAAAGGPLFGALLDRSRRPDRLLAATLAAYATGIIAIAMRCGRVPAHQRAPGGPGVPPAGAGPVRKDGSHGPFGKMTYACRHAMRAECCVVADRLGRSYSALVSRPSGMGGLFRAPDGPDPRGT